MKICLDAGHYGKYNKSPADGRYYESDMVWKLHLMLKRYLEEYGIQVITTRINQETDKVLYDRGAASAGCNLFISLHSNATGSGLNNNVDYPVSYCAINGRADDIGLALAKAVQTIMQTKQASRIEHRAGSNGDYYGVLRGASAVGTPALILEHSFHTNAVITAWLLNDTNLDRLAKAEADTIAKYYGIQKDYILGWNKDKNGWWYADSKTTYYKSCWKIINGHKYYFNPDGYAVTGWQVIDGKDYYFEPRAGHDLECALYVSDPEGAQHIGEFRDQ